MSTEEFERTRSKYDVAFEDGQSAAFAGKSAEFPPYPAGSGMAIMWLAGHHCAVHKMTKRDEARLNDSDQNERGDGWGES